LGKVKANWRATCPQRPSDNGFWLGLLMGSEPTRQGQLHPGALVTLKALLTRHCVAIARTDYRLAEALGTAHEVKAVPHQVSELNGLQEFLSRNEESQREAGIFISGMGSNIDPGRCRI
jgi:hypothetical protein